MFQLTIKENLDSDEPLIKARFTSGFTSLHQFGLGRIVCIVTESGRFFMWDPSIINRKAIQYEPTKAFCKGLASLMMSHIQ